MKRNVPHYQRGVPFALGDAEQTRAEGAELESDAAVQCSSIDHYVRVHAISDDHIVIDAPGQQTRAHKKVLFEEVRAQGMFYKWMVLR